MTEVRYPTGVRAPRWHKPNEQPSMKTYNVKPVRKNGIGFRKNWPHRHSKYNAHKIRAYGHIFDSKVEYQYYCYLRFILRVPFKMHQRFVILPHTNYIGKTDGRPHAIRQHNYTPDFCIYNVHGNLQRVIDVKGMKTRGTAYDHLRFDCFSRRYSVPVFTVRKRQGQFITEIWGK